jgi:putative oxidoreductase
MKLVMQENETLPVPEGQTGVFEVQKGSGIGRDFGLLILRLITGGLLTGHGSQKLFGWFSGPGLQGTAGWLESLGMKPGTQWARAASSSEFGGGLLTSLGFLHPIGPLTSLAPMIMATAKAHWGKPIWVSSGGAELPVTNMAAALALTFTGPGRFSLDRLFGIRLPRTLVIGVAVIETALIIVGINTRPAPSPSSPVAEEARDTLTSGQ